MSLDSTDPIYRSPFFNQLTFDNPPLHEFITRTEAVHTPHQAYVVFSYGRVEVKPFLGELMADSRTLPLGNLMYCTGLVAFVPSAGL